MFFLPAKWLQTVFPCLCRTYTQAVGEYLKLCCETVGNIYKPMNLVMSHQCHKLYWYAELSMVHLHICSIMLKAGRHGSRSWQAQYKLASPWKHPYNMAQLISIYTVNPCLGEILYVSCHWMVDFDVIAATSCSNAGVYATVAGSSGTLKRNGMRVGNKNRSHCIQ